MRVFLCYVLCAVCTVYGHGAGESAVSGNVFFSGLKPYAEISLGYGGYAMESLNSNFIDGYSAIFHEHVNGGMIMEAGGGLYINNRLKAGLSYIKFSGGSESDLSFAFTDRQGRTITWDYWYMDVYFRGVKPVLTFYPFIKGPVRGFAGAGLILGAGSLHMGMGEGPENAPGDYGYDNFKSSGAGFFCELGVEARPARFLAAGFSAGGRILRTNVLVNNYDGSMWHRPANVPSNNINLDFSGFYVAVKAGIEL